MRVCLVEHLGGNAGVVQVEHVTGVATNEYILTLVFGSLFLDLKSWGNKHE